MRKALTFFGCLSLVALLHCGHSDLGESCDDEGKIQDCVDDAVCAKNKSGSLVCAHTCNSAADCGTNQDCNGVSNTSLKACQDRN